MVHETIYRALYVQGWRNLVERWFKEFIDKRLRRGVFTSVDDLIQAITRWAEHWVSG